jgi:type VI secretion system VgrG family protein
MPDKVIRIKLDGFGDDDFTVVSFTGVESISKLWRYELVLGTEQQVLQFDDLLNAKAELILGDPGVHIRGMLASVEQGYDSAWSTEEGPLTRLDVVFVPTLWKLSLNSRTRIFKDLSVPDIIKKVISVADPSSDVQMNCSGDHPAHEYVIQFQESDLNFIQRLAEREGIFYYFVHGDDGEQMVVGDDNAAFQDIPGQAEIRMGAPRIIPEQADRGPWGHEQTIQSFRSRQHFIPKKVILQDYNYETSGKDLKVEGEHDAAAADGVQYAYGEYYKDTGQGNELLRLRKEGILSGKRLFLGGGNVIRLYAGGIFSLTGVDEINPELGQEYVVTEFTVQGAQQVEWLQEEEGYRYGNRFTCIPKAVTYRPELLTPRPRVMGLLHAKVEGESDTVADIDDKGRYLIKFAFDIPDGDSDHGSIRVRLMEPYVGNKYGFHSPLIKGQEVLVGFENGDPDRPIIVAGAYNDANPSPVKDSNNTQNIHRTGIEDGNELIMEDKKDHKYIWMRTPDHETYLSMGHGHEERGLGASGGVVLDTQESISMNAGHSIHISSGAASHKGGVDGVLSQFNRFQPEITAILALLATASAAAAELSVSKLGALWSLIPDVAGWGVGAAGYLTHKNIYISSPTKVACMAGGETFVGAVLALDCVALGSASLVGGAGVFVGGVKSASVISRGNVEAVSLSNNVILHAKKQNVKIEAHQGILVEAKEDDIRIEAEKKDIIIKAKEKNIAIEAKENIDVSAETGHFEMVIHDTIHINSNNAKNIRLNAGGGSLTIQDAEIKLKIGSSSITMKDSEIEIKSTSIKLKADANIELNAGAQLTLTGSAGVNVNNGALNAM